MPRFEDIENAELRVLIGDTGLIEKIVLQGVDTSIATQARITGSSTRRSYHGTTCSARLKHSTQPEHQALRLLTTQQCLEPGFPPVLLKTTWLSSSKCRTDGNRVGRSSRTYTGKRQPLVAGRSCGSGVTRLQTSELCSRRTQHTSTAQTLFRTVTQFASMLSTPSLMST
jgi:hypothetical protein